MVRKCIYLRLVKPCSLLRAYDLYEIFVQQHQRTLKTPLFFATIANMICKYLSYIVPYNYKIQT